MYLSLQQPKADNLEEWVDYLKRLSGNQENSERKRASYRLHQLYKGKQREETRSTLIKRVGFQAVNKHPIWIQNVLKQGVGLLASTYDGVVERSAGEVPEEVQYELENIVWADKNDALKSASESIVYDRMVPVQVSSKDGKVSYHSYNQYQFDWVREDGQLIAVILSDYAQDFDDTNWFIYTTEYKWHIKASKLVSQEPNTLGIIPFVIITADELGFQDYLDPLEEYADGQIEINCMLSGNLHTQQIQSHAVMWVRLTPDSSIGETAEDPSNPQLDVNVPGQQLPIPSVSQAIILTEDEEGRKEEIGYTTPGVNFKDLLEVGKEYVVNYLSNMGIPRDTVNVDIVGGTVKPATAGYLAERKLNDLNSPFRTIFAKAEKKIYEIALLVAQGLGVSLDNLDPNDYVVTFASPPRRMDTLEISELEALEKAGVIDVVEVLRTILGINREDALKQWEKFDAFKKKHTPAPVAPNITQENNEPEE